MTETGAKTKLVLESPAKINLTLEVLGRRADGFHSIRSVLAPISLHDTVTFAPGGRKLVFHGGQGAPKDDSNLAVRAVHALQERTGVRHGVDLRIVKRIPIAAGLGGGSSNAATVLRGLNELWDLRLSGAELERIGLTLGSDVPFFLRGGTCLAGGRGEELEPLPRQGDLELVLVHPPVKVASQWAYEHVPAELVRPYGATGMVKVALASGRTALIPPHLTNDLEPGVAKAHPVVAEAKRQLIAAGALGALMSGSGPTVFGVAPDAETADRIAERVHGPGWKVFRAASPA
jgi:4-diphosphocytidyl-2-C-methyl-D-erythritol kinase